MMGIVTITTSSISCVWIRGNTDMRGGILDFDRVELTSIGDVKIYSLVSGPEGIFFMSGMMIDADGAPNTYHPDDIGLDNLANAGRPGNWWGIVTANGQTSGDPVIQGPQDPFPGYYISQTSLQDKNRTITDPARYVNSIEVPYVVLPQGLGVGVEIGDLGMVINLETGVRAAVIYADVGPCGKIGEGSIALAKALGINPDPKNGGTRSGIAYIMFPGSGQKKPLPVSFFSEKSERCFAAFGGMERVKALFP